MSNKIYEQFIKGLKNMNLSGEEKFVIKQSILNFISLHPVRSLARDKVASPKDLGEATSYGTNPVRQTAWPCLSQWSNIFLTKLSFAPIMAILLIITVMVGGGVAFGAEKALPGDILYPVKVELNEEVRSWLSVSEESKANWEIERAQRRLEEAETLAENGSLDVEAREKIEANFEEHAERVKNRIEKFENKENFRAAADVSSKFETSLKAHHRILNRLTIETENEVKKEVKSIEAKVRSEAKTLIKTGKKIELKSGGKVYGDPESVFKDSEKEEYEDYIGSPRSREDDLELELEAEIELKNNLELNLDNGTIRSQGRLKANLGL